MLLFTWNLLRKENVLRLALGHLKDFGTEFIAVFQELPTVADSTAKADATAQSLTQGKAVCLNVINTKQGKGRLGIFTSPDIAAVTLTSDPRDRMIMATLRGKTWTNDLHVVAYHAVDRLNKPTEYGRAVHAVLSRQAIETFWPPNQSLIVMGDFNADPYDVEVSDREGIFAIRDRDELEKEWKSDVAAAPIRPLYNPMWRLLPERQGEPGGTYLLKNPASRGIRWRICDQILISKDLVDKLDGNPEILSTISKEPLLTQKSGSPKTKKFSDHLPVQLRVKL